MIELSCPIMEAFAGLKAGLTRSGVIVGDFDLLIAATAMSMGYCVVSNNEKHFSRIPDLVYENWAR